MLLRVIVASVAVLMVCLLNICKLIFLTIVPKNAHANIPTLF